MDKTEYDAFVREMENLVEISYIHDTIKYEDPVTEAKSLPKKLPADNRFTNSYITNIIIHVCTYKLLTDKQRQYYVLYTNFARPTYMLVPKHIADLTINEANKLTQDEYNALPLMEEFNGLTLPIADRDTPLQTSTFSMAPAIYEYPDQTNKYKHYNTVPLDDPFCVVNLVINKPTYDALSTEQKSYFIRYPLYNNTYMIRSYTDLLLP